MSRDLVIPAVLLVLCVVAAYLTRGEPTPHDDRVDAEIRRALLMGCRRHG